MVGTLPLRAVALIRMSSSRQASSPQRQRDLFAEYCARHHLTPVGEYEDLATSATHTPMDQRPGLMAMWRDVSKDLFDVVWCEEASRAAREMSELLVLEKYLRAAGVAFVAMADDPRAQVDPALRKLLLAVEGFKAETETRTLGRRIRRDAENRLRHGRWSGQKLPPGIRWEWTDPLRHEAGGRYVYHPETAIIAQRAFAVFSETRSINRTARQLTEEGLRGTRGGQFHLNALRTILLHPMYRGRIVWGGQDFEAEIPEVVAPELVAQADAIFAAGAGRPQRATHARALFAGLLKCRACGRWLSPKHNGTSSIQYVCAAAFVPPHLCDNRRSRTERIIERALLPRVATELRAMADRMQAREARPRDDTADKLVVLKRLEQAEARARRLYVDGLMEYSALQEELERLATLKQAIPAHRSVERPAPSTADLQAAARAIEDLWPHRDTSARRDLLQSLIAYIVLDVDDPAASEIVWRHE